MENTNDLMDRLRGDQVFRCYDCDKYVLMKKQKLVQIYSEKEKKEITVALCPDCLKTNNIKRFR